MILSEFQHFHEMPWNSIILARTLDNHNLWGVQRYAAICGGMRRYAAICSGIIKIPGVPDESMENMMSHLNDRICMDLLEYWGVLEYMMVWDISTSPIFLWIYQHSIIFMQCLGFLSFEEEQLIFSTFEMSSDMQRYAAICRGIIEMPGVLDELKGIYDISLNC